MTPIAQNFLGYRYRNLPFAVAELSVWGALPEGVSGEPTEDPVKNGTCSRPVRHHRWLKGVSLPFRVWRGS